MVSTLGGLVDRLGRIGARPTDDDVRVRKRFLAVVSVLVLPPGVIWGLSYLAFGEPTAAAIPLAYSAASALGIVAFAVTGSFRVFRTVELLLILLLPFLLQVALGGFIPSSAVIVWAMLCPFGALVFGDLRSAFRWFGAFVALVVVSALLQERPTNNLPPWFVTGFFVLNVTVVATIAFVLLASFVRQIAREHARAEGLLLNILPASIARRLKQAPGVIADSYDEATILFADVVNSTPLTSSLSPRAMVTLLDEYVAAFDGLARREGAEKIRTIGDNWMGVVGVPVRHSDHAPRAARLALAMLGFVRERKAHGGICLEFRIGINSGPVVGGVIGRDKFVFDIWGDAVNLASRMESTGVPGRIQVGPGSYPLLVDAFTLEPRGMIAVKGKGEVATWFLLGPAE
jgi:guanylate cyclase